MRSSASRVPSWQSPWRISKERITAVRKLWLSVENAPPFFLLFCLTSSASVIENHSAQEFCHSLRFQCEKRKTPIGCELFERFRIVGVNCWLSLPSKLRKLSPSCGFAPVTTHPRHNEFCSRTEKR